MLLQRWEAKICRKEKSPQPGSNSQPPGHESDTLTTEPPGRGYFHTKTRCSVSKREYSITCIKRPLKGSNESGLLQQVVFKCRFYKVDFRRVVVSEQWSLKAGGHLIQVVSNTGLTVYLTWKGIH